MNPELDLLSTKNDTNKITKQAEDESDVPLQVGHNVSTDGTKIIKNSQQSEDIFQQVVVSTYDLLKSDQFTNSPYFHKK